MIRALTSPGPLTWVTIEKLTQQLIWLVIFAILAPILGPHAYGLFAIVMVLIGLSEHLLLDGTTEALLTIGYLDRKHTSTANLCNCLTAIAVALVTAILAPSIAYVFADAEIKPLLWVLTPLPVLSSLMATPVAVLRHSSRFKRLAIRVIIAQAAGGLSGVGSALAGAGVWALVFQVLAQRLCDLIILWFSVPEHLCFGWSGPHFREMKPVALNVFASRILSFAGGQIPRVIIGYDLGPTQLGLYTLAGRILDLIIQIAIYPRTLIGRVELRFVQPGSAAFGGAFRSMVMDVATLCLPLIFGIALLAPDLFAAGLGSRWVGGDFPTQLLVLSGLPLMFFYCSTAGLMAVKRSGSEALINLVQSLTLAFTVLGAAPFGLDVTCMALLLRPIVVLLLPMRLSRPYTGLSAREFLIIPLVPLSGAILMIGVAYCARLFLRSLSLGRLSTLILLTVTGVIVYLLCLQSFAPRQLKHLVGRMLSS
jgi:O-antigen/teichoic acid export membrane protein